MGVYFSRCDVLSALAAISCSLHLFFFFRILIFLLNISMYKKRGFIIVATFPQQFFSQVLLVSPISLYNMFPQTFTAMYSALMTNLAPPLKSLCCSQTAPQACADLLATLCLVSIDWYVYSRKKLTSIIYSSILKYSWIVNHLFERNWD